MFDIENESDQNKVCKNCSTLVKDKFCSNCGQSINITEINHKFVFKELSDTIFKVNHNFLYTVKELFISPGEMLHNYIDGKRIKYFKPISYLLLLVAIYVALEHNLNRKTYLEDLLYFIQTSIITENNSTSYLNNIINWLINNAGYSFLIYIPLIALSTYLAFYKSYKNYSKHLVINIYITAQMVLIYIIIILINLIFKDSLNFIDNSFFKSYIATFYTIYAYFMFFDRLNFSKRIIFIILSKVYLIAFILIIFIILELLFNIVF